MQTKLSVLIVDANRVTGKETSELVQQTDFFQLKGIVPSVSDAADWMNREQIHLLILDAPSIEGHSLEPFRKRDNPPKVVKIIGKEKCAVLACDLWVVDFLFRPVLFQRFHKTALRVMELHEREVSDKVGKDHLYARVDGDFEGISVSEVFLVESRGDYVCIYTPGRRYTVHCTLTNFFKKLPPEKFVRVHRSFIVRLDSINGIEPAGVKVNDKLIPIGGTYREHLMDRIGQK